MDKVVLTTDSGICAKKKENSIIIPAQIVVNGEKSFSDDGTITNRQILDDMKQGVIYKTASPLLGDFEKVFRNELEQGKDVIHLSMGSGISQGSVNGANLIAGELNNEYKNKVYVIDSLTGATGGTLLYELAYNEIINSNKSSDEIVKKLENLKTNLKTAFYVPNIDGFRSSGRDKTKSHIKDGVLAVTSKVAKIASIKFRVDFHENGDLYLKKVFRSPTFSGMDKMVREIVDENNITSFDSCCVAIGSLYKNKVDLDEIKKYLLSFNYFENVVEQDIGPIIAPYGCDDLCGISLVKKNTLK